jgi:hypothetical protein
MCFTLNQNGRIVLPKHVMSIFKRRAAAQKSWALKCMGARTLSFFLIATCCRAHPVSAQVVPTADRDYQSFRKSAFLSFNANYEQLRAQRVVRAISLGRQVLQREASGENTMCAHQILTETKWLLGATADFRRIDQRLDALQNVIDHPELEHAASRQDPNDGSWGRCYTEWFFRLDATYDHLNQESTRNQKPMLPYRLLDRVNSPARLRKYFEHVSISNIARNGVDNRRELNESMADLMRLILQDRPVGYRWNPRLKAVLMDIILHRVRNPKTGWWGERYIFDEHTEFVDSLSLTFHIVRYLNGHVPNLQSIIETALAFKDLNGPAGWLDDGHFTDHNNKDVAVLFRIGWSAANARQRQAMAEQLQRMLNWCLTRSLQADGSFAQGGDDSLEENTYFGVAFLSRIGFFDRNRRFWTKKDFPEAPEIRRRIIRYITEHQNTGAVGGTYYENALRELSSGLASSSYR